jgi:hypothetical protein
VGGDARYCSHDPSARTKTADTESSKDRHFACPFFFWYALIRETILAGIIALARINASARGDPPAHLTLDVPECVMAKGSRLLPERNKMERKDLSRRDFTRLTAAAFGGIIAGTSVGCGEAKKEEAAKKTAPAPQPEAPPSQPYTSPRGGKKNPKRNGDDEHARDEIKKKIEEGVGEFVMLSGKNVCRGLNVGKNHKGGKNECAGRGDCALAKEHGCHGENECKGQGGCGEKPGLNECKGKGECAVPLMDGAWTKARASFEKAMAAASRPIGPAPEPKK